MQQFQSRGSVLTGKSKRKRIILVNGIVTRATVIVTSVQTAASVQRKSAKRSSGRNLPRLASLKPTRRAKDVPLDAFRCRLVKTTVLIVCLDSINRSLGWPTACRVFLASTTTRRGRHHAKCVLRMKRVRTPTRRPASLAKLAMGLKPVAPSARPARQEDSASKWVPIVKTAQKDSIVRVISKMVQQRSQRVA